MWLDKEYDNVAHVSNAEDYPERWAQNAERFRNSEQFVGRARLNIAYGQSPRQAFDLFYPAGKASTLAIFIHGGYWRRFSRTDFSHCAAALCQKGCIVALPSYDLCPDVHVADITKQIAKAVDKIAQTIPALPMLIIGHSAGGHLAARMADPANLPQDIHARIRAIIPISPVTDLRPLLHTSVNEDLHLDEDEAHNESPALAHGCALPAHVWVGEDELPAFVEQSQKLADAWGCPITKDAGQNHFTVVERLEDNQSDLIKMISSYIAE